MMHPNLDTDFDRLIASFEAIADIRSTLKREYTIARLAKWHGLTQANMKRFFRIWLTEQLSGGES